MKYLGLLILLILFMGVTCITSKKTFYKLPTQKEVVKRKELKLEVTQSKVETEIAEIKFYKNID